MVEPFSLTIDKCYDTCIRAVKGIGTSAGVLLPQSYKGKVVRVLLMEEPELETNEKSKK